jgi:putative SOS response-associated peptidase YedK
VLDRDIRQRQNDAMCNLYSMTKNQDAIRNLFRVDRDLTGNLPSMPSIFPDYPASIIRNSPDGTELTLARWGMPSSQFALMQATKKRAAKLEAKGKPVDFKDLLRMEPDSGTTNIRNVTSKHWARLLGPASRCLVPFTSFSEFNKLAGGDIWFAFDETRPLAFLLAFGPIGHPCEKSRKVKTTNDIFGFLTTEPNAEVREVHPKAMPVILTTPEACELWMTATADEALTLQRPLPDGALKVVARGTKKDGVDAIGT